MSEPNKPVLEGLAVGGLVAVLETSYSSLVGAWTPPNPDDLEGEIPNIELSGLLGHGSMGAVYRARQTQLERDVAVKILRPDLSENPEFVERFRREARSAANLRHPNIITIHDFGSSPGGLLYIVMEQVEGADLAALISESQLPLSSALQIATAICEALQHAHDAGLVHRDLKPSNILIGSDEHVVLSDFGIVIASHSVQTADPTLTGTTQTLGTYDYMAPEQRNGDPVDHRADVFAFGVLLYQLVTGKLPQGAWNSPSKLNAQVSKSLDSLIQRLLSQEPGQRPDLGEVRKALDAVRPRKAGIPRWGLAMAVVPLAAVAWFVWNSPFFSKTPRVEIPELPGLITPPALAEGRTVAEAEVEFHRAISQSRGGIVGDDFALTFDTTEIADPVEELGYRPIGCLSFPIQGTGMTRAMIWNRDYQPWVRTEAVGVSRIRELDEILTPLGFQLIDFPSPRNPDSEAAIWGFEVEDWREVEPIAQAESAPNPSTAVIQMDYRMSRLGSYYLTGQPTGDLEGRYLGWREEKTTLENFQQALDQSGPNEVLADACFAVSAGRGNSGHGVWLLWHEIQDSEVESAITASYSIDRLVDLMQPYAQEDSGWKPVALSAMHLREGPAGLVVWQR